MSEAELDGIYIGEASPQIGDAEVLLARVELIEAKYPRATQVGFVVIDRGVRLINLALYMVGVVTVLRWLIF